MVQWTGPVNIEKGIHMDLTDEQRDQIVAHARLTLDLIEMQVNEVRNTLADDGAHAALTSMELSRAVAALGDTVYNLAAPKKMLHMVLDDFESEAMRDWKQENHEYLSDLEAKHREHRDRVRHTHEDCKRRVQDMFPGATVVEVPLDENFRPGMYI